MAPALSVGWWPKLVCKFVESLARSGQFRSPPDADVTGRPEQINIWLPVTDSFGANCLWVESEFGKGDHQPVPVHYGQALFFDGFLSHGTVPNDTDTIRCYPHRGGLMRWGYERRSKGYWGRPRRQHGSAPTLRGRPGTAGGE